MEFDPNSPVIKLCVQGLRYEEGGRSQDAAAAFLQAWNEASEDFEKFIAAFFVSKHQLDSGARLKWLETALQLALKVHDEKVQAAFPLLYLEIAKFQEALGDLANAKRNRELSDSF